jgi:hypothetical protein
VKAESETSNVDGISSEKKNEVTHEHCGSFIAFFFLNKNSFLICIFPNMSKLLHYTIDAILLTTLLAGIKRSTGLQ